MGNVVLKHRGYVLLLPVLAALLRFEKSEVYLREVALAVANQETRFPTAAVPYNYEFLGERRRLRYVCGCGYC